MQTVFCHSQAKYKSTKNQTNNSKYKENVCWEEENIVRNMTLRCSNFWKNKWIYISDSMLIYCSGMKKNKLESEEYNELIDYPWYWWGKPIWIIINQLIMPNSKYTVYPCCKQPWKSHDHTIKMWGRIFSLVPHILWSSTWSASAKLCLFLVSLIRVPCPDHHNPFDSTTLENIPHYIISFLPNSVILKFLQVFSAPRYGLRWPFQSLPMQASTQTPFSDSGGSYRQILL